MNGQPGGPGQAAVRVVTRLVAVQAVTAAAVGLAFSRGRAGSVLITLALAAACGLLAWLLRGGGRPAWLVATMFEAGYFLFGLSRFFAARYLGGTLFALVIIVVLCHPAVARAYAGAPAAPSAGPGEGA